MRLCNPLTDYVAYLKSLNLSPAELQEILKNAEALEDLRSRTPLEFFSAYPKQREFIRLGKTKRERLFMAGNRCGKTETGCFEIACHLTGNYPDWFDGKRFDHPTTGWACGASAQSVRDVIQIKLFGQPTDEVPMGFVPKDSIIGNPVPSHGVGGGFDLVRIRHKSGGTSTLLLKSYEQAVGKWMGSEIDFCLVDEEPPLMHYDEALARVKPGGCMMTTFTPLFGMTELLMRFLREEDKNAAQYRAVVQMSLDEAEHFTQDEREQRIAGYATHLREARTHGVPAMGSGAVFRTPISDLLIEPDTVIPVHWSKLWALDFGLAHPFAAVLSAWDRDRDVFYVLETIRMTNALPVQHVAAMNRIAPGIRVAYPHDGSRRESSGETLASQYRKHGLPMLGSHASFADGSIDTENGILEMDQRMASGRFKVKGHNRDWIEEYMSYHRNEKGDLVKARDDLMSATRIGIMAMRAGRAGAIGQSSYFTASPRRQTLATGVDFELFEPW